MKKTIIAPLLLIIFMCSCGFTKHVNYYQSNSPSSSIDVIYPGQSLPDGLTLIGSVNVRGKGSMKKEQTSYFACLEMVKTEANKMGGDCIYLVDVQAPNKWSTIGYTIAADVYKKSDKKENNHE